MDHRKTFVKDEKNRSVIFRVISILVAKNRKIDFFNNQFFEKLLNFSVSTFHDDSKTGLVFEIGPIASE